VVKIEKDGEGMRGGKGKVRHDGPHRVFIGLEVILSSMRMWSTPTLCQLCGREEEEDDALFF
jgi:hypothetical protein